MNAPQFVYQEDANLRRKVNMLEYTAWKVEPTNKLRKCLSYATTLVVYWYIEGISNICCFSVIVPNCSTKNIR